jgi:hypothetical protein
VPPEAIAAAREAFSGHAPRHLAELVFDSLVAGVDPPTDHRLRFEHPLLMVELRIRRTATEMILTGAVVPTGFDLVVLTSTDSDLRFVGQVVNSSFEFSPVGRGIWRLAIERRGQEAIWTDWFTV